ncbi:MAG: hypothetical protein AAGD25_15685 [Cyanobacteria bacterium P01_F01_bin.150]
MDHQERYEEYLHLAKAEGFTKEYLTLLGKLGRFDQAVSVAQAEMTKLTEAKALAETLREQNQHDQALNIALKGFQLENDNHYGAFDFAIWTSELAAGLGRDDEALEVRIIAFKLKPSFKDYQKIRQITEERAGEEGWSITRTSLLNYLQTYTEWGVEKAKVDIFLYEERVEDAIATVSDLRSYDGQLIMRVMDVAIASHSQWVIDNARPRAESIMDEGKAQYYNHAVEWLKRVKAAYQIKDLPGLVTTRSW